MNVPLVLLGESGAVAVAVADAKPAGQLVLLGAVPERLGGVDRLVLRVLRARVRGGG